MTPWLLAAALLVLTAPGLLACEPDPSNSEQPATIELTATANPTIAVPVPTDTAVPTLTPIDTSTPTLGPWPTATNIQTATATPAGLLRLADNLDDPQGYCVDVAGFGANIRLNAPLQAHTCKPGSDDQLFRPTDAAHGGGFRLVVYDRCLAAAIAEPGAMVSVAECDSNTATQGFSLADDGRVQLALPDSPALCLSVAGGYGEPAGGRNHLRRDLILQDCKDADLSLITWDLVEK